MRRFSITALLIFTVLTWSNSTGIGENYSEKLYATLQDSLKGNQILYNGKLWRNIYYNVQEDQFLFSKEFLPGTVTISGKTFKGLMLKYDIFKDELLTPVDPGGILQLNKEMVDSFSLFFRNKTYYFEKIQEDSLSHSKMYANILYKGKAALYLKYTKKIEKLAVEGKYDRFYQISRLYFVKRMRVYPVYGRSEIMKIIFDNNGQVKNFIKKNKVIVSEKEPESLIPVLRYYDTISQQI